MHDLLFDDVRWRTRYLVADTRRSLAGRKVLISTVALNEPDWPSQEVPVTLSRDHVRNGPGLELDEPVSRQHERTLSETFGWPAYWVHHLPAWPEAGATAPRTQPSGAAVVRGDPHLRSAREVVGYRVHADDGDVGRVNDLIVESDDWSIRYLMVDTQPWWPGGRVILAPGWTRDIDWAERRVHVELTRALIRGAPPYDPTQPVNRAYEERLYDHYGRPRE